jgi:hypothetical protein
MLAAKMLNRLCELVSTPFLLIQTVCLRSIKDAYQDSYCA